MSAGLPNAGAARETLRATELSYDIHPERAAKQRRFDPSHVLWRYGARTTESVWTIPDRNLVLLMPLLREWEEKWGMEYDLVRYDERDSEAILNRARRGIEREAARVRTSLEATRDALAALVPGLSSDPEAKDRHTAQSRASNALRRARRSLTSLTECAAMFDILGDVAQLLDGVKHVVRVNDALFYGWFKEADAPSAATAAQLNLNGAAPDEASAGSPDA